MVQEFHVLRCFSCQTFQVHQVKKGKKWNCKMCGEKQSLVKVYGRGTGADCRRHVQKLNSLRGELHEAEHARFSWEPEGEAEERQYDDDSALACGTQQVGVTQGAAGALSRWNKYLSRTGEGAGPEEEEEAEEEEAQIAYHSSQPSCPRKAGKRKRSWGFSTPSEESACTERSGVNQSAVKAPWNRTRQRTQPEVNHDSCSSSWAASQISHDASSSSSRRAAACEDHPRPHARRVEPEVRSSKWSRFLSVPREEDERGDPETGDPETGDPERGDPERGDPERGDPERDTDAGTSRGGAGSGEALGFPSVSCPPITGRFEEHGRLQEEVCLTGRMFVGSSAKSPEIDTEGLSFSPGCQRFQTAADHRVILTLNSRLPASAAPVTPQNLSISKPHPSLYSLFQTDEDFDDII